MARTPPRPGSWWLKILVLFAAIIGAFFLHLEIQSHLGERAREATQLERYPLEAALQLAAEERKLVLAQLSAVWCGRCRALENKVFAVPEVRRAIERYYVLSLSEYESPAGEHFTARYGVDSLPTLLLLRPDGSLVREVPVTMDPVEFLRGLVP